MNRTRKGESVELKYKLNAALLKDPGLSIPEDNLENYGFMMPLCCMTTFTLIAWQGSGKYTRGQNDNYQVKKVTLKAKN